MKAKQQAREASSSSSRGSRAQQAKKGEESNPHETSKAARRDAMRKGGVPTSQPLMKDKTTQSDDEVYVTRDKEHTVQNAKEDVSHKGKPHWEAGKAKKNESMPDGLNRSGNNRKPQMQQRKGKSYYKPK